MLDIQELRWRFLEFYLLYSNFSDPNWQQNLMSLNTEQGMDEAQERKHRLNMHRMKNALFQGESLLISIIKKIF